MEPINHEQTLLHNAAVSCNDEYLDEVLNNTLNINVADSVGRTALHKAAHFGVYHSVESLIKKGADVNVVDERGYSPLYDAVYSLLKDYATSNYPYGEYEEVKRMIIVLHSHREDSSEKVRFKVDPNLTNFSSSLKKTINLLLDNGAKPDNKDKAGLSVIDTCFKYPTMNDYLSGLNGNFIYLKSKLSKNEL